MKKLSKTLMLATAGAALAVIQAQAQGIASLRLQLQQQNASLQERLSKLESYVAAQTQVKTASDVQPVITASPNGSLQ